jgi:hypothetical protein
MTEEKQFQSIVMNKVIHRNAVLQSKTVFSRTASVTTENLAFDEVTGEALLTKTTNEFNDYLYSFKYPAWWMYEGMGPAYRNTRLLLNSNNQSLSDYSDFLMAGDELWPISGGEPVWVKNTGVPEFEDKYKHPVSLTGPYMITRPGARNMLSLAAGQVVTWNMNPLEPGRAISFGKRSILNSSAIQYNDAAVVYCDTCRIDDNLKNANDYFLGKKGNWKAKRSWFYLTDRTPADLSSGLTDIRTQGLFQNYNDFWVLPPNGKRYWGLDSSNWEWKEKVNLADADGQTIETEDRIGRRIANLLGYKNTLVTAQAYNSGYTEALSEGFEEYSCTFCPVRVGSFKLESFKRVHIENGQQGTVLKTDEAHTGRYVLQVDNTLAFSVVTPDTCLKTFTSAQLNNAESGESCNACMGGFYPEAHKTYLFSCWVKLPAKPQPVLSCSEAFVEITGAEAAVTMRPEGPVIEDWQRIMGTFTTTSTVNNLTFTLHNGGAWPAWYDDIRILPVDGNMVAYVYDERNYRRTYDLDENNYFTQYQYNNQGELIRIRKETERGIVAVKEGNQSLTKQP